MKQKLFSRMLIVIVSLIFALAGNYSYAAAPSQQQVERIQGKAKLAKQGVIDWKRSGKDPSRMLEQMSQIKPALNRKDFDAAEALLDNILGMLESEEDPVSQPSQYSGPVTDEFGNPEKVTITGYSEDAMEPFISRDGKYLFFNNLNDPHVNTNLYYAERIDALNFEFKGEVEGVNSSSLEGVPSMDQNNKFCFVSNRKSSGPFSTIYCGDFNQGETQAIQKFPEPSGRKPPWFNMDFEISPNGEFIYYSENEMQQGSGAPKSSNLAVASYTNNKFEKTGNSDELMKNINSDELEYAPSISTDGLELYFTRASELIVGNQSAGADLRIFMATRETIGEPFGPPVVIGVIEGFVEGPTITADGKYLYYHKRVGSSFQIFRVTRMN